MCVPGRSFCHTLVAVPHKNDAMVKIALPKDCEQVMAARYQTYLPTEDELRAAYEAELARLTTADLIAQSIVSLLNMAARRLGPPGGEAPATGAPAPHEEAAAAASERDLDQLYLLDVVGTGAFATLEKFLTLLVRIEQAL